MAKYAGFYETAAHTAVTVTGTTQVALAANKDRLYVLFINDSDTICYLAFGQAAVSSEGIRLNANGGSFEMSTTEGNLFKGVINVIGGTTKNLTVLEGTP
jgi:hypothetical protein